MPLPVLLKCSPSNISAAIALRCFAQSTRSHAAACGIIGGTGWHRRTENVLDRQNMIVNQITIDSKRYLFTFVRHNIKILPSPPLPKMKFKLKMMMWYLTVWFGHLLKRLLDIVVSAIMLTILSPFLLLVAIAIKLESKGAVIYRSERVGKNGRHFTFYKFRSMRAGAEVSKAEILHKNDSADGVIFKMKNDPRITRIGRFIRKFSIDELPQLFNVLEGTMSLVGPRPPLPSEVALYTLDERKRLHIKPGITCIWQISGRSDIPFYQQVKLDEEYIRNHGLFKDLIILLKTIPAILSGRGAY